MKCPYCDHPKSRIIKTVDVAHDSMPEPARQRRRICVGCSKPFYTYEVYAPDWRQLLQLMDSVAMLEDTASAIRTNLKRSPKKPMKRV